MASRVFDPDKVIVGEQIRVFGESVTVQQDAQNMLFVQHGPRKILIEKFKIFLCSDGLYRDGGKCPFCERTFLSADGISQHTNNRHKRAAVQ